MTRGITARGNITCVIGALLRCISKRNGSVVASISLLKVRVNHDDSQKICLGSGGLPPGRTQELHQELLKLGVVA
jgi:hypothetical protein